MSAPPDPWRSQGKPAQARNLPGLVYGLFTEGFDIGYLKEAKPLLDELGFGFIDHPYRESIMIDRLSRAARPARCCSASRGSANGS